MNHPFIIMCAPLPLATPEELLWWRAAFEAALAPQLDARQIAHVRRFDRENMGGGDAEALRAGLSRLLARALLAVHAGATAQDQETENAPIREPQHSPGQSAPSGPLRMDALGRPRLEGWQAAFCHSGLAAFCALRRAPRVADEAGEACPPQSKARTARPQPEQQPALDAEALSALPPAPRAFAPGEAEAPLGPPFAAREALRRWTVKEALLKASGLGLSMDPALVPSGGFGQRSGLWEGPRGPLRWRGIPCPGHWLCLAHPAEGNGGRPAQLIWHGPQNLPRLLARLQELQRRS